jgi:hypothetical protein
MKSLFITLILTLVFSADAFAKKANIISAGMSQSSPGTSQASSDETGCSYSNNWNFCYQARVHAHPAHILSFQVLTGDSGHIMETWQSAEEYTDIKLWCKWDFHVPIGESWSLVWVLETTKGKGRVIDAAEMDGGTCE